MKILRRIFYISLISTLAAIIAFLVVCCCISFDFQDIPKSLTLVATTLTGVTSSLGVCVSTASIIETRKQFSKAKESEVLNHWYNELIVKRYLSRVIIFFDSCKKLVGCINFEDAQKNLSGDDFDRLIKDEVFSKFTPEYTELHKDLTLDLDIFDKKLSGDISDRFSAFQDEFSLLFDEKHIDTKKIDDCIKKYYGQIIGSLKSFDPSKIKK